MKAICIFFLFSSPYLKGQVVVSDPAANVKLFMQIKELKKSTETLEASKNTLESTKTTLESTKKTIESGEKYLQKASSVLKSLSYLNRLISLNRKLASEATKLSNILNTKASFLAKDLIEDTRYKISNLLESGKESIKIAQLILKDNGFKMNDYERLKVVEDKLKEFQKNINKLKYKKNSITDMVELEMLIKKFSE